MNTLTAERVAVVSTTAVILGLYTVGGEGLNFFNFFYQQEGQDTRKSLRLPVTTGDVDESILDFGKITGRLIRGKIEGKMGCIRYRLFDPILYWWMQDTKRDECPHCQCVIPARYESGEIRTDISTIRESGKKEERIWPPRAEEAERLLRTLTLPNHRLALASLIRHLMMTNIEVAIYGERYDELTKPYRYFIEQIKKLNDEECVDPGEYAPLLRKIKKIRV